MLAKLGQGPRIGYDASRVGAQLSRGPQRKNKLRSNAAVASGAWPAPGAIVDLDFANDRGYVKGFGQGRSMDAITFTRASSGTFVGPDGLLAEAGINAPRFDWRNTVLAVQRNYYLNSNIFATIFNSNSGLLSVTPNAAAAPIGGSNDAVLVTQDTSTGNHRLWSGFAPTIVATPNTLSTISFFAKFNGVRYIYASGDLSNNALGAGASFDLQFGVAIPATAVSPNGGQTIAATMIDFGGGWYRCTMLVWSGTAASRNMVIWLLNDVQATSYTGDGTSGVYLWGAQFENGDTAMDYCQVGALLPTNTPFAATPVCNGLLIEQIAINRALWCRDATNAVWAKTNVTAAKDQTGIDGAANAASSLTATADGGTCIQTITLASGIRASSLFLKRLLGTGPVQISLDGSTWSTVDLVSDAWRRVVLAATVTNPIVAIRFATSGDAVAMDYAQIEDNWSATSPILTTSAAATRSSDIPSIPSAQFEPSASKDELSFIVAFKTNGRPAAPAQQYVFLLSGAASTGLALWQVSSGTVVYLGPQTGSPLLSFAPSTEQENIMAGSYRETFSTLAQYGVSQISSRNIAAAMERQLAFWIGTTSNGNSMNGSIRRIALFPFASNQSQTAEMSRTTEGF